MLGLRDLKLVLRGLKQGSKCLRGLKPSLRGLKSGLRGLKQGFRGIKLGLNGLKPRHASILFQKILVETPSPPVPSGAAALLTQKITKKEKSEVGQGYR